MHVIVMGVQIPVVMQTLLIGDDLFYSVLYLYMLYMYSSGPIDMA